MATDYGRDTLCINGLRTGRYAVGVWNVAQTAYHRIITPRGTLRGGEDEENFGLGIEDLIGHTADEELQASLPGQIYSELRKDERITDVDTKITAATDPDGETTYEIDVRAKTGEGPFQLVLTASAVKVELLKMVA